MVSLRSGARTTRPSPAAPNESVKNDAPSQAETPIRRGRSAARTAKKVFEEQESPVEKRVLTPVKTPRTTRRGKSYEAIVTSTEEVKEIQDYTKDHTVKEASVDVVEPVAEKKSDAKLDDKKTPTRRLSKKDVVVEPASEDDDNEGPVEEPLEPVDVESDSNSDSEVELMDESPIKSASVESESEDDDDEPMEVSSKKPTVVEPESEDDDNDEPMEVSSKKPTQVEATSNVTEKPVEAVTSVVDKLLERNALKAAKSAAKKLKKKNKRKETKKITDGVFQVRMQKSSAKFNVVTLKKGVQKVLEPTVNFREELLKSRTAGSRCTNTEKYLQRSQWVSRK